MQQHLSEEQLIELYYGDLQDGAGAHAHLAGCQTCAGGYRQLVHLLEIVKEAPVPERGEEYGREVYLRLLPMLEENAARPENWSFASSWRTFVRGWSWTGATALAMLLVCAFLAGHFWQPHATVPVNAANAQPVRERVLLVALGDHLDRSQMVLVEMQHAQATSGDKLNEADISAQQQYAEDLIADNRLYRQAATQQGDTNVAGVLEDLERILMEIANSPSKLDEKELEDLQKRIEDKGILFKVRVIGSAVREKQQSSLPVAATGRGKL
jgi:hypothetical protein